MTCQCGAPLVGRQRRFCSRQCKQAAYVKEKRREIRIWMDELRSGLSCIECGENHPATLDFHHRDPSQKGFTLSRATTKSASRETLLVEIEKCDVLCANCHRKHH